MTPQNGPRALDALGPFFALAAVEPPAADWQSFGDFLRDGAAVADRIEAVRGQLAAGARRPAADVPARAAASVMHLGLVARVLSPFLGAAALGNTFVPTVDELYWQPAVHSGFPLGLTAGDASASGDWAADLAARLIAPLDAAVAPVVGSPTVLTGNVASAANGAVAAVRATRPDLVDALTARAEQLLPVIGSDTHRGRVGERSFRRRSCCLIHQVAPGPAHAVCGDCVLLDRERP